MRYLLFALLIAFKGTGYCQQFSFEEDIQLANHLLNKENNQEAIHLLKKTLNIYNNELCKTDTLNFLLGKAYYQQKDLSNSNLHFLKVSENSAAYPQARLTSVYNSLYDNQYSQAADLLKHFKSKNDLHAEYKAMQTGGLALLEKDYSSYPAQSKKFTYNYFQLEKEQTELDKCYQDLVDFKPKSMAVAGLFSAVIPGTGKLYAGKLGEGLSSFFIVSILGAMATENYLKNGINNYKTIAFGSLFSIFYLGNIYGSMVSVKVYRDEFYKTYERKILVNLHIPLRNIFY